MSTTPLDPFTIRHLHQWFERGQAPCSHNEAPDAEVRMVRYLQSLEADDQKDEMDRGWSHVFDASNK